MLELLVHGFGRSVLCLDKLPRATGMAAYVRDGYGAFHQPKIECCCCCCGMVDFRVCGVRENLRKKWQQVLTRDQLFILTEINHGSVTSCQGLQSIFFLYNINILTLIGL